mgnify:CR=1 FL=1
MGALLIDSPVVHDFISPVTNYITSIITKLLPGSEIIFVLIFSFFIAYIVKHKNGWNKLGFIGFGLALFGAFRYFGIGG